MHLRLLCSKLYILAATLLFLSTTTCIHAQQMRGLAVEGYITALHLPDGFDVNGEKVVMQPHTTFGLEHDKRTTEGSPLRSRLQVGAYVWVLGDSEHHRTTARTILFWEDWDQKLSGAGPVDKVISAGTEPVFSADGYAIRIPASAETSFRGNVQSLADIGAGTWIRYEGKRDNDGMLVAEKARFVSVKPRPVKVVDGTPDYKVQFEAPKMAAHKDGHVKLGSIGKAYSIPADEPCSPASPASA